ncbi:MAG TPA: hypothetical protein VMI06_01575 [Terriglobia bacterium]|nr:hypothetical protein [Terriglobia bacterium]
MTLFPPIHDEPIALEKTNQLERILLSETFERQDKPIKLLRRLVNDSLAGIIPEEHQLGIDLFDRRPDWITLDDAVVRQNMTRLRKLLDDYYTLEGMEDRLNLELHGYQPAFTYNPRNPVERSFRLALKYLATDPATAFSYLGSVLNVEPEHAEALAAWGEAELWRPMTGNEVDVPDLLVAAEAHAGKALRYDKNCWRAHIVAGAVHLCRREWNKARRHFGNAFSSSPDRARSHPWYAAFLLATGQTDEALELTKAMASVPVTSPWPRLTHAFFLYAARRFGEAKRIVMDVKSEHPDNWLSHVAWSCVFIASGHERSPAPLLGMSLLQSLPDGTVVYTALSLYEHLLRSAPDDPDHASVKELIVTWLKVKETALATPIDADEPPPFTEIRVSPFHLAIGYMALDNHERAVMLLRQDAERGHPLMTWLHLWPLFDPLRELPEFKRLISDMKLPQRPKRGRP